MVFEVLLDLLFPARHKCLICGGEAPGLQICCRCIKKIEQIENFVCCWRCGRVIKMRSEQNRVLNESILCPKCKHNRLIFKRTKAVGIYEGVLKEALHCMKYKGKKSLTND